jgi:hypothetical protein
MTTLKTLTIAATLILAPSLSLAMGCSGAKHQQAQSCATGTAWDAASQTCIPSASS